LDFLMRAIHDRTLTIASLGCIVEFLLSKGSDAGYAYVQSVLTPAPVCSEDARARKIEVATRFALSGRQNPWPVLGALLHADPQFGESLFLRLCAGGNGLLRILRHMTEEQCGQLFAWLHERFPEKSDTDDEDNDWVTPRQELGQFRNSIIEHLKHRGTSAACEAIEHLASTFPEVPWLRWAAVAAKNVMLQATWIPLGPRELLGMLLDEGRSRSLRAGQSAGPTS
jgi:hypothetical protein